MEQLIGDYKIFFSYLYKHLTEIDIPIEGFALSHLNYRVATMHEYETTRERLKDFSKEFVETQFNGRAVSVFILKEPLVLAKGFAVPLIELPAPREAHTYPTGLEHLGINVGDKLPEFKEKYKDIITGVKDRRPYCYPAFITFENGITAKFYERSLREVVLLQGWKFEKLQ